MRNYLRTYALHRHRVNYWVNWVTGVAEILAMFCTDILYDCGSYTRRSAGVCHFHTDVAEVAEVCNKMADKLTSLYTNVDTVQRI